MAEAFKTIEIPNYGPVNFPVTMSDDQVNSAIAKIIQPKMELRASQPAVDQEVESLAMKQGRQADLSMPSKMALSAAQGLTFNFAPKIAGVGAAGLDILQRGLQAQPTEAYANTRDYIKGVNEQFRETNPKTAFTSELVGGLPLLLTPLGMTSKAVQTAEALSAAQKMAMAAKMAGTQGTISAVGASDINPAISPIKFAEDVAKKAAIATAAGGVLSGTGQGIYNVGSNVAQRYIPESAKEAARIKLAQALQRGSSEEGANAVLDRVTREMGLNPNASIAQSGGPSALAQLDVLASMPGQAKTMVERRIREQQTFRPERLINAADEALGTQGKGFTATLEALDATKKATSAPLYKQLENVAVKVDPDLQSLIQASTSAHGKAELLTQLNRQLPIDISKLKVGDDVPLKVLDVVKQSLYDMGESARGEFSKATNTSRAYDDLRVALTKKLEALSPRNESGSIYRQALDAYAGPSQLANAVNKGRTAMKQDDIALSDLMGNMSKSELEAFRIGALQSLKDKVGTEAGQTSLLKMWKEPTTSNRLKEIFGDNYQKFAQEVSKEARLKPLEQVGRGSGTFSRIAGAEDLGVMPTTILAGKAMANVATGNPLAAAGEASNIKNRIGQVINQMPETTRNELAKMLLLRGSQGKAEIDKTAALIRALNQRSTQTQTGIGSTIGQNIDQ
tara:strand:+ start:2470 stop:4512 length:2043 start_codon:yes stop_codon:yes gene_type:complete